MSTRMAKPLLSREDRGRVLLRRPRLADSRIFLAAVKASRELHAGWVEPPATGAAFAAFVARSAEGVAAARNVSFLLFERRSDGLAGVFNLTEIVRGGFQSAFLGYYGFAGFAGRGLMREGLVLALDRAFGSVGLHRVEINVQPDNVRSIVLAEGADFEREGYSRRYLKVAGRWRDHVRYALLAEDWRARWKAGG